MMNRNRHDIQADELGGIFQTTNCHTSQKSREHADEQIVREWGRAGITAVINNEQILEIQT